MTAPKLSFDQAVQNIRREYEALGELAIASLCIDSSIH